MSAPPIAERHLHHFHRRSPIKEAVRVATTANITLSGAQTIDGVSVIAEDRVLVTSQTSASGNGIYRCQSGAWVRDYDESTDDPAFGYLVFVREGTANGGTLWKNTNTTTPTIGSTSLTFSQFSASASFATPSIVLGSSAAAGAASTVIRSDATIAAFDATSPTTQALGDTAVVGTAAFAARRDHKHAMPTAAVTTSGLTQATNKLLGRTTASTGAIEEIGIGSGLTFSGGTLAASGTGGGGGGGVTIQFPGLKPSTPTYDFADTALDGAFSAHSSQGSFGTGNCFTQGEEWSGSSLEMQFSAQMGALYVSHSNTDFDFTVGGMRGIGFGNTSAMMGIAALNSSGTGVGVVAYNDGSCYFATITTWGYTTNSDSWGNHGILGWASTTPHFWFRLKRVSGTWTGYISTSGRTWDKTLTTRADSITVDRLATGLFYDTAVSYSGRLTADYFQVDV